MSFLIFLGVLFAILALRNIRIEIIHSMGEKHCKHQKNGSFHELEIQRDTRSQLRKLLAQDVVGHLELLFVDEVPTAIAQILILDP